MTPRLLLAAIAMIVSVAAFSFEKIDLGLLSRSNTVTAHRGDIGRRHVASSPSTSAMLPASDTIAVMVALDDICSVEMLRSAGIDIKMSLGHVAVCTLEANSLDDMEQIVGVRSIAPVRQRRLLCDAARLVTGVDILQQGSLGMSLTGRGVIIGIIDSGIDPNHVNFLDAQGCSRVKRIWQYQSRGDIGICDETVYATPEAIAGFTTDCADITHATHVLGIAAGSCSSSSFQGMAPEADIVIVCGDMTDHAILAGLKRIADYADSQGSPCVVNISLGSNIGHHDGSDPFTSAINEIAAIHPVVIASGNEACSEVAIVKTFTEHSQAINTFLMPNDRLLSVDRRYQASGLIEVIGEDSSPFSVSIGLYDISSGEIISGIEAGEDNYNYFAGPRAGINDYVSDEAFDEFFTSDCYFGAAKGICPDNGRYYAYIDFDLYNYYMRSGVYPVVTVTGLPGKRYEMYADGNYTRLTSNGIDGFDDATPEGSINDMACGPNPIAVGAFVTKTPAPYSDYVVGQVAGYSSFGIANGMQLPHLCAPGNALVSSLSRFYVENVVGTDPSAFPLFDTTVTPCGSCYWGAMAGTSMAAPVMTGVAALWLQAAPELTPQLIRDIAVSTASVDSFVYSPEVNPMQWGAGKLDAVAGVLASLIPSVTSARLSDDLTDLMIAYEGVDLWHIVNPSGQPMKISVTDITGKIIINATTESCDYMLDLSQISAGAYIARIDSPQSMLIRKFLK